MIYFTQLIYIKAGQEAVFDAFEAVAIPIISRYKGVLLLRVRPTEDSYIAHQIEKPYEIHFGTFEGEEDFQDFMKDEERKSFLHLKEQAIKATVLVKGSKL
jgi:hypothetical protein